MIIMTMIMIMTMIIVIIKTGLTHQFLKVLLSYGSCKILKIKKGKI